jgi:CspA family cold shock protein
MRPTKSATLAGAVKWFNTIKGYGFIQPDDSANSVFFQLSDAERSALGNLQAGQRVSFDIETGNNGKTRR